MRRATFFLTFAATGLLSACATAPHAPVADAAQPTAAIPAAGAHRADVEAWRKGRLERLQEPTGWLSLVGLHWLTDGDQTVGSAADNDIVLAAGPAHVGVVRYRAGVAEFAAIEGGAQVIVKNGVKMVAEGTRVWHVLADDTSASPSVVRFDGVSFVLIKRGDKHALRVRDPNAPTRVQFKGIEHFPVDEHWRIVADWTAHDTPRTFGIQTVIGTIDEMPNPGYATFTRDGREYRIYPVIEEGSEDLFIIFADRTSGKETYGPGRFLYAPWPKDGKIVLDFNKAYNPPCALNAYSTCPLPPPENRLDLRVTAGEKKYDGAH